MGYRPWGRKEAGTTGSAPARAGLGSSRRPRARVSPLQLLEASRGPQAFACPWSPVIPEHRLAEGRQLSACGHTPRMPGFRRHSERERSGEWAVSGGLRGLQAAWRGPGCGGVGGQQLQPLWPSKKLIPRRAGASGSSKTTKRTALSLGHPLCLRPRREGERKWLPHV